MTLTFWFPRVGKLAQTQYEGKSSNPLGGLDKVVWKLQRLELEGTVETTMPCLGLSVIYALLHGLHST